MKLREDRGHFLAAGIGLLPVFAALLAIGDKSTTEKVLLIAGLVFSGLIVFLALLRWWPFNEPKTIDTTKYKSDKPRSPAPRTHIREGEAVIAHRQPGDIDLTPKELIHFFDGRTDLQADAMVRKFIGEWMTVTATVRAVYEANPVAGINAVLRTPDDTYQIWITFREPTWETKLMALSKGDVITVRGKISKISSYDIKLDECMSLTRHRSDSS